MKKTYSFLTADAIINRFEAGESVESIHKELIKIQRYKNYTLKDIKNFLQL
ncbi:MAG TPA: hypothetical protein PKO16_09460 [Bacteroidia bacterium]|nr:hypothetical protein [Bacteroidia bacterium]